MSTQEESQDTQTVIQMLKDGNWETVAKQTNARIADRKDLSMDLDARNHLRTALLRNYEYFYEHYQEAYMKKKELRETPYDEGWLRAVMESQLDDVYEALNSLSKEIEWQKEALESSKLLKWRYKEEYK